MITVKEVSKLTGISVRTLHHYDKINLLKPTMLSSAGYRLYDNTALSRLQNILLFRELSFSLKEIKIILDSENFNINKALEQQIDLLILKRNHINKLINLASEIKLKGENTMDFSAFDKKQIDEYTEKAKEKWGNTSAYMEYENRSGNLTSDDQVRIGRDFMKIFEEIGENLDKKPSSPEIQGLVKKIQDYITKHYYTCTDEIFLSLADMYVAGDSMTANIDKAGGIGTAQLASDAIKIYCS